MIDNGIYCVNIVMDDDEKDFIYYFDIERGNSYRGHLFGESKKEFKKIGNLEIVSKLSEKISSLLSDDGALKIMSKIPLNRYKIPVKGISRLSEEEYEKITKGLEKELRKIRFYIEEYNKPEQKTS